ncbi:MAG: alanine--tRNA ligase [FCB group bacterium]|nr:alanine--tRNA ligase [FCB group bacterium]
MTSKEIRRQFLDFFLEKEHTFVRSSPVVPLGDPTLLFINAGMNQFKPVFLGQSEPVAPRVVNTQKCIRVSGKHNDLEEVGVDDYHHTFFEMLGNWSFGDYYKQEAIQWAWELLTEVWKIDKQRLWVTIYEEDDEAGELWAKFTDIPDERILKFGTKDNFWEMGDTGPCGPCSEIHYYSGDDPAHQSASGVNRDPDYREIWNLVFIQYNRQQDGTLTDLPRRHVDTGAGFERIVALLNGHQSNYETDLFIPLLRQIVKLTGKPLDYKAGVPHRVIADHLRMLSFSIADGALPGNEGRGYVLRRVLRRAARFGRLLEMREPFIFELVDPLIEIMGEAFPEIIDKKAHIKRVIRSEEISFGETLDRGLEIFARLSAELKPGGTITGKDAFKLYDTYGFPLDLTQLLAREKGFSVDISGFDECMQVQRERARAAGKFTRIDDEREWTVVTKGPASEFIGYEQTSVTATIRKYAQSGEQLDIILDKTPFYPEQGGQVGDRGILKADTMRIVVTDTFKTGDDIIHRGTLESGNPGAVRTVEAEIDTERRTRIRLNHTATHLLHKALKMVLGEHVNQAGSLVSPDRLRFDLTHFEQLSRADLKKTEYLVNAEIRKNRSVKTTVTDYKSAVGSGATALFGEKYGSSVRVVEVPGFSRELCGGTHASRTGDIGIFKIISESALAAGVRRIEALTGDAALEFIQTQESLIEKVKSRLKCSHTEIPDRIDTLLEQRHALEKELETIKKSGQADVMADLLTHGESIGDVRLVVIRLENSGDLKELGDIFRTKAQHRAVALVGAVRNDKPMVLCAVTDDLTNAVRAGEIVKQVGAQMGGGGGGRPHLATAGGRDIKLLDAALEFGAKLIREKLQKAAD